LTGGSGGQSVAITDAFNEEGLDVPKLTQKSYDELGTFFNLIGGGYGNPIDTGNSNRAQLNRIMQIVESDANIDNVVLLMGLGSGGADAPGGVEAVVDLRQHSSKPVLAAVYSPFSSGGVQEARRIIKKLQEGRVPAFSNIERAATALRNTINYYRFRGIAA
jgi:acyl-CoA synthetase (NDP forming)